MVKPLIPGAAGEDLLECVVRTAGSVENVRDLGERRAVIDCRSSRVTMY